MHATNPLTWTKQTNPADYFKTNVISEIKTVSAWATVANGICDKYKMTFADNMASGSGAHENMTVAINPTKQILLINNSKSSVPTAQDNWLDGVKIWLQLATPITYDTLYYRVGNSYVPMEEVFPNGIQGLCCNWASENLVEQAEVDGQPQSITPVTTEVFQSDMKELLKTIGDTYVSKESLKDNFDNLLSSINTNSGTVLGGTYATDGFNDDGTVKFKFTANQ